MVVRKPYAVRLDAELEVRLKALVAAAQARAGVRVQPSDVIRLALGHGFSALEAEFGIKKKGKK